jgi:hypothetical protein
MDAAAFGGALCAGAPRPARLPSAFVEELRCGLKLTYASEK